MPHPTASIRNRIKSHRRIRAGDLVPHEWNFRLHPDAQKTALQAIYTEVGFARSLLAYALPDGRLKLIDGHLRRDLDPDMEVDVEVLDLTDDEARKLLLTLDPLAALARSQEQIHQRLQELTPTDDADLRALWQTAAENLLAAPLPSVTSIPQQFLILITCRDEKHQCELLARFHAEALDCKPLIS